MERPDGCAKTKASLADGSFFKKWLIFLKPYHSLTDREMDVAAMFLKKRFELGKVITDPTLLDSVLMGAETRKQIIEECGLKLQHFQGIVAKMKKCGVMTETGIEPRFIPEVSENAKDFKLLIYFILE